MMPLVLLTRQAEKADQWIDAYIQQNSTSSYNTFYIKPLKTDITIDQIRELKKELITSSKLARLFILYSFDNATNEAQNALLKTLEEKNENNQFILIAQQSEKLLPTIRSRVKIINLDKNESVTSDKYGEISDLLQKMENDPSYSVLGSPLVTGLTKDEVLNLLDDSIMFIRTQYNQQPKKVAIVKKALQLKSLLSSNNLNPQLTLDSFLIFYKKSNA